MNVRAVRILSFLFFVAIIASCGGKSANRKLVEAAEIHKEMMARHDSIYHALIDKRKEINERFAELGAVDKSANESMLRSISKSLELLHGWEASVVGVPGFEFEYHHHHAEGEEHNHDHGNKNDEILRGMSDQEVLDLQKALKGRLNEVAVEIYNLLDTIKMYEERER